MITSARATAIRFDGRRATGIALRLPDGDREIALRLGGELLLAAGAVNSPQLLMLSGVGPGEELKRNGIALRHDIPELGRNLQDHLDVTLMHGANSRVPIGLSPSLLARSVNGGRSSSPELASILPLTATPFDSVGRPARRAASHDFAPNLRDQDSPRPETSGIDFHGAPTFRVSTQDAPDRSVKRIRVRPRSTVAATHGRGMLPRAHRAQAST